MKKILKILLIIVLVIACGFFIYFKIKPGDDTKKLYVSCGSESSKYSVLTGNVINFDGKDSCKIDFEVMNVDKDYLKLKADKFLYSIDGNGNINEAKISKDVFVVQNEKLTLFNTDKKTKYIFEYK